MTTPQDLRRLVISTFADRTFPVSEVVAGHDCEECTAVRDAFREQSPFAMQPETIKQRLDSLPLLSPRAFHHFLPAYLLYAIDDPDSEVAEFLLYSLAPNPKEGFWIERFSLFCAEERGVIRAVLKHLASHDREGWRRKDLDRASKEWGAP